MAKIYVQSSPCVWGTTASMAANASQSSGSFFVQGYARLVGTVYSSGSLVSTCGVYIRQSSDGGSNYDYVYKSALSEGGASGFSIEVVGDVADVGLYCGADNAASVRAAFRLRPV